MARLHHGRHPEWVAVPLLALMAWALAAIAPTVAGAKDDKPKPPDTWYVATVTSSETGALITHYWSLGRLFRAESVLSGHRIVTIVNGKYYYTLDPVLGEGLQIERGPKALEDDARGGRPFAREFMEFEEAGAEPIREEVLGGTEVDVYQLTDQRGRRRIWVRRAEPRLPFRMEVFDRRRSSTNVIDYSGWAHRLEIAESFFVPDSNIELTKLTYEAFREKSARGPLGPVPVLYRELLHGLRAR